MKALELLNEIKNVEENKYHKTRTIIFDNDDMDFLDEAIAELEELVKLKTCEGCKNQGIDIDRCDFCKRYYSDQYEPKANA